MTRAAHFTAMSLATIILAACAALPDDAPVVEQLDPDTGATVTRLGRPVELYRENFVQDSLGHFAFLGPFETNQMGNRELFLWVAAPIESPPDAPPPTIEVNGKALTLGVPGRAPDFAGLRQSPYKNPTPWISTYYYKIDAGVVEALRDAHDLAVRVSEPARDGTVRTLFTTPVGDDPRLREFAARN